MEKSGYGRDDIIRSLRPPLPPLPKSQDLNILTFLFRNLTSHPHRPALIDSHTNQTIIFSQLRTLIATFSHSLLTKLNINKNDVVLIFAPNSVHYPICFYGIVGIGTIATTVNPSYTVFELRKQIQDSKPKVIITVKELVNKVESFNLPIVLLGDRVNKIGDDPSSPGLCSVAICGARIMILFAQLFVPVYSLDYVQL